MIIAALGANVQHHLDHDIWAMRLEQQKWMITRHVSKDLHL